MKILEVSWEEPADTSGIEISTYTVYWRATSESKSSEIKIELSSSSTMQTIEGLMNGMGYWVEVSATNNVDGEGIRSTAILSTPRTVPGQVENVIVTAADRMITVIWNIPNNGGAAITTFRVYAFNGATTQITDVIYKSDKATTTSTTISSLLGDTLYQVAVSAFNEAGEGPQSSTSSVSSARTPISVARAPSIDELDSSVDHALTVRWSKPTDNGGAAITSYAVSWSGPGIDDAITTRTRATTYTISGLRGNEVYDISVVAFNSEGAGAEASTQGRTRISVPTTPTSVSVTPGDETLAVSWGEPADRSNVEISTYTVYWRATTESASESTEVSGSSMAYTIEGLTNGVGYWVAVSARSSAAGEAIRSAAILSTPRRVPDQVENVIVTAADRMITVIWNIPNNGGAAITTFRVYASNGNGGTRTTAITEVIYEGDEATTRARTTISSLLGNTTYQITVSAVNEAGEGPQSVVSRGSSVRTPVSGARAPRIVGLDSSVDHVLAVRWTEPSDNGGASITSYAVSWMSVGSDMSDEGSDSTIAGVTTYTISGLRGNTTYQITVAAFNEANLLGEGATTIARTLVSVPTVPTSVSVTPGDETLAVSWGEPSDRSGVEISTYTVYWRATTESVSESTELSGNSREHTIERIDKWCGLLGCSIGKEQCGW